MSDFSQAPLQLKAFAIFSIAVVALDTLTILPGTDALTAMLKPTFGWLTFGTYLFAALFSFYLMRTRSRRTLNFLITVLAIHIVAQILMFLIPRPETSNPYLMVSPLQPVWGVLVPLLWIGVLLSRPVRAFAAD